MEESKFLVRVHLELQAEFTGTIGDHGKRREHQGMTLLRGLLLADFASNTSFRASEEHLTFVSRPAIVCVRSLLSTFGMLALTDWGKKNSTFREEPPKMVTFHEN